MAATIFNPTATFAQNVCIRKKNKTSGIRHKLAVDVTAKDESLSYRMDYNTKRIPSNH